MHEQCSQRRQSFSCARGLSTIDRNAKDLDGSKAGFEMAIFAIGMRDQFKGPRTICDSGRRFTVFGHCKEAEADGDGSMEGVSNIGSEGDVRGPEPLISPSQHSTFDPPVWPTIAGPISNGWCSTEIELELR